MKPGKHLVLFGAALSVALSSGCVDPFSGSALQVAFIGSQTPGEVDPDSQDTFGRPPAGTHYTFVAVEVLPNPDPMMEPLTAASEFLQFEINPVIDIDSPCFLEFEETDYPGLHSTEVVNRLRQDTGLLEIGDEFQDDVDPDDAVAILTARDRVEDQFELSTRVRIVTSHSPFRPQPAGTLCAGDAGYDPADFPRNNCIDDASNAARLELCTALFNAHPDYYEGNDQVFSLPLSGTYFGAVDGFDPRTNQPYSGAVFTAPTNLANIDALLVNYQFNCTVEDFENPDIGPERCEPQTPAGTAPSIVGFHYMAGDVIDNAQRGELRVDMVNNTFTNLRASASIIVDLDDDDVNF